MSEEITNLSESKSTTAYQNQEGVKSKLGLVALGVTGTIVVGLFAGALPFLTPALRRICLPYVPATSIQIQNILQMCKGRSGRLVDLGSGDGRVVLAAAQAGYQSVGYELNLWLVLYSKMMARLKGLNNYASFSRADLWKTDLKDFDTIVIFGVDEMMPKLQEKFACEMKYDARVLACRFPLPDWKPEAVICAGIDTVWRYRKCSLKKTKHKENGLDDVDYNLKNSLSIPPNCQCHSAFFKPAVHGLLPQRKCKCKIQTSKCKVAKCVGSYFGKN